MATTKDCVRLQFEETPRYEGAPSATPFIPYRISTVSCDLPIQSALIDPAPSHLDRSDELRGLEGGPAQLVETYAPAGSINMRAYANSLVFLLNACGLTDTITVGDGIILDPDGGTIPTGVQRHVFTKRTGLTAKTFQALFNYVTSGVFLKGSGYGVSNLTLNAAGDLVATLMGLVVGRTADPNITPSYDSAAIKPFRRGDLFLTWNSGSGVADDFDLAIANPLDQRRSMGLATTTYFPDKMEQGDAKVALTGSVPMSTFTTADFDALVAASTFAAKARWVSPDVIGATARKYSVWIEMPSCQILGGQQDALANRRRFGGSWNYFAAWDETAGYDFKITVLCSVAAVETYTGT